jgi:hypothetical protein
MRKDGFSETAQAMPDWEALRSSITRENALELLCNVACLYCGAIGNYSLFVNPNNLGTGIRCDACGKKHPFMGCMKYWLPGSTKTKSSTPIDPAIIDAMSPDAGEQWMLNGDYRQVIEWADGNEARLRVIARLRGYASGWVWHVMRRHNPQNQSS